MYRTVVALEQGGLWAFLPTFLAGVVIGVAFTKHGQPEKILAPLAFLLMVVAVVIIALTTSEYLPVN